MHQEPEFSQKPMIASAPTLKRRFWILCGSCCGDPSQRPVRPSASPDRPSSPLPTSSRFMDSPNAIGGAWSRDLVPPRSLGTPYCRSRLLPAHNAKANQVPPPPVGIVSEGQGAGGRVGGRRFGRPRSRPRAERSEFPDAALRGIVHHVHGRSGSPPSIVVQSTHAYRNTYRYLDYRI
jgi:hypothetical protein